MKKNILILLSILLLPSLVLAMPSNLQGFIDMFLELIDIVIPILSGFIMILFFYGIAQFILAQGKVIETKMAKSYMIWSVVGIFLLVSLWGIIQLASNELEFGKITKPTLPQ
jgi:hypothetical protein